MAISAISGFSPAISLIGFLSPLNQLGRLNQLSPLSQLRQTTGLGSLLSIASAQASISDIGRLLNNVETLQTAASALSAPGLFVARTVATSSTAIATAAAGAATPSGAFALQVDQLARAQTLTTATQASSLTTIGDGEATTLSFQFAGGSSRSVTLGTDNTLAGIASAINAAGIGVEAKLLTSASGVQLALTGQTGAGNAFSIDVAGDAAVADLLAFPGAGSGGPTLSSAAQDARGAVNGIAFSASTNNVNTAVAGLSLNLGGTGTATLTVTASNDAATAVRTFVDAFNAVRGGFSELAAASPALGLSASFLGATLSAALIPGGSGNPLSALARVGLTSRVDGTLTFSESAFQAALDGDPAGVATVFSNAGKGIAEQVAAHAAGPLSPERLLPVLTPALLFQGSFGTASNNSLLLSLFDQGSAFGGSDLSSSFGNDLLFAGLIGARQASSGQSVSSLVELMLAQAQLQF